MYAAYPDQYFDLYLYSPPFGVLFAPFSLLPFYIGYFVWNNFSVLIIPLLIFRLKGITDHKKYLICYIALIEILTCMQGTQKQTSE
ncbi:MAG: glycosyltransferase family 87 protein, partial [Sphingobacteriales bacterium]|nr:glycosyltransferase family 87 protein [Sphingobacteriales bacterium]